ATDPVPRCIDGVFGYLVFHYRIISQPLRRRQAAPQPPRPMWHPVEQHATPGGHHAYATADSARSCLFDRTGTIRRPDSAGSAVPGPPTTPDQGLENPGPHRVRLLLLPLIVPAPALGRHAGAVSALEARSAQPVRRRRHRRAGVRAAGLRLASHDAPGPLD